MTKTTMRLLAATRAISLIAGGVLALGGCGSAPVVRPAPAPGVEGVGALAAVRVHLTPQGRLSIDRVDSNGLLMLTHVSIDHSNGPDQGFVVATNAEGTDVLVVWYERGQEGVVLSIRRSRLGHLMWSRSTEGRCAALDAEGDDIPGGCSTESATVAEARP